MSYMCYDLVMKVGHNGPRVIVKPRERAPAGWLTRFLKWFEVWFGDRSERPFVPSHVL